MTADHCDLVLTVQKGTEGWRVSKITMLKCGLEHKRSVDIETPLGNVVFKAVFSLVFLSVILESPLAEMEK